MSKSNLYVKGCSQRLSVDAPSDHQSALGFVCAACVYWTCLSGETGRVQEIDVVLFPVNFTSETMAPGSNLNEPVQPSWSRTSVCV